MPLFGIGLLACGIGGCVGLASVIASRMDTPFRAMAPAVKIVGFVLTAFGNLSTPINPVLLPLAYAGFRRSAPLEPSCTSAGSSAASWSRSF